MKKAMLAVLASVLVLSLFACGNGGQDKGETETYDYDSALTETGVDLDIGSVILE